MAPTRIIICLLACLALPAGASAGTVAIADGALTFTAAPGEDNTVSVSRPADGAYVIRDAGPAPSTVDPACVEEGDTVKCAPAGVTSVRVLLGDLNDTGETVAVGAPVTLDGGDDGDRLTGGDAADTLLGGRGDDDLLGGAGADDLRGERGDDNLDGGAGADTLDGGDGGDVLVGGADGDTVAGGPGNDDLQLRDGATDSASCGSDADGAVVDFPDVLAADCELVDRPPDPNPAPAPTPAPPAPTPPPASPTTASPPPRDRTAPVILVSRRSIRVDRRGRFRVVLVSANESAVGDIVAETDARPRARMGRAVFVLRTGARTPVRISLTAAGRRALRRARGRSVATRVRITARDGAGNVVEITAVVRVRMR